MPYVKILSEINRLKQSMERIYPITGSVRESSLSTKKNNNISQSIEECLQLEEIQVLSEEIYEYIKKNVELLKIHIKTLEKFSNNHKNKK
jgi:Na+/phosphate symporter